MGSLNQIVGGTVYLDANILIYAVEDIGGCTTFLTNDSRFEAVAGLPVLLLSKLP